MTTKDLASTLAAFATHGLSQHKDYDLYALNNSLDTLRWMIKMELKHRDSSLVDQALNLKDRTNV